MHIFYKYDKTCKTRKKNSVIFSDIFSAIFSAILKNDD